MTSLNGNIFRVTGPLICVGNSPVTGEFPAQRSVTRSSDVLFDLRHSWVNNGETGDLKRHLTHYDVTLILFCCGYITSSKGLQMIYLTTTFRVSSLATLQT